MAERRRVINVEYDLERYRRERDALQARADIYRVSWPAIRRGSDGFDLLQGELRPRDADELDYLDEGDT